LEFECVINSVPVHFHLTPGIRLKPKEMQSLEYPSLLVEPRRGSPGSHHLCSQFSLRRSLATLNVARFAILPYATSLLLSVVRGPAAKPGSWLECQVGGVPSKHEAVDSNPSMSQKSAQCQAPHGHTGSLAGSVGAH
jgi:hypothetical protein